MPLTKHSCVLDLDDTLVHTFEEPVSYLYDLGILNQPHLMELRSRIYILNLQDAVGLRGSGVLSDHWGIMRPHLFEFLKFAEQYFNIICVWSAGKERYVDAVCRTIFRQTSIRGAHIVYNWDQTLYNKETGEITKQLSKLLNDPVLTLVGNPMTEANTFVLDDLFYTFSANPHNGILIPRYNPAPTIEEMIAPDDTLVKLQNWFLTKEVMSAKDIRYLDKRDIFSK